MITMKHINLFFILFLAGIAVHAQQLATSSFYDMQGILHNPATAGAQRHLTVGGSFRTQWEGMPGGPKTGVAFANGFLSKSRLGLGGYVFTDKAAAIKNTGVQLAIAYHIPLKNNASLSLGLEGRFQQFAVDRDKLNNTGDPDPLLMSLENRMKGDAGFGIAFNAQNFQVGASVSQLIQSKLKLGESSSSVTEESRFYRHYYLHGHYIWNLDDVTKIIPNAFMIYLPNAPLEFQGGARVEHNNTFWYGLTWRARQAWMLSAGLRLKDRFNIGYSFDVYNTPLSIYSNGAGAHEIMLRYDFIK